MSQLVHAVGMRDVNKSVFRMNHFSNHYMIFACMSGIVLQALVTEIPYFIKLFGTVRLSLKEWGMLSALSAMPLVVHELLVVGGIAEQGNGRRKKGMETDEGEIAEVCAAENRGE